jgi:hypothetical protein
MTVQERVVVQLGTVLPELQNGTSPLSELVLQRCSASDSDGCRQRASRKGRAGRRRVLHRCNLCDGQERGRFYMIEAKPENLIGDRAYDSDPLDETLHQDGIEMIAPHRSNRSKPPTQDRRRMSRYLRRWLVERFFAIQATSHPRPLGVSSPKLPRFRPARLPYCPVQAILR